MSPNDAFLWVFAAILSAPALAGVAIGLMLLMERLMGDRTE